MRITNIHERVLEVQAEKAGKLIDSLASDDDPLWPHDRWPAMHLDRPLGVGADGGHGPIGYMVEAYEPGRSVRFRFTRPSGFIGGHLFEVDELEHGRCALRHTIEMTAAGWSWLAWVLAVRWLHDALIEDALDRAAVYTGGQPRRRRWSVWVRFLRWAMRRGARS